MKLSEFKQWHKKWNSKKIPFSDETPVKYKSAAILQNYEKKVNLFNIINTFAESATLRTNLILVLHFPPLIFEINEIFALYRLNVVFYNFTLTTNKLKKQ